MAYLLQRYYILVNSHTKPLKCQFCFKKFSAEDLENHFFSEHRYRFPSSNSCPWCAGNRSWKKPRQKCRHARHLLNCFKRYKDRYEWVDYSSSTNNKICDESREFYGRPKLCEVHPYAYESVFLPPPPPGGGWWNLKQEPLCLEENENLGMHYVREFIHFDGSSVCWFHLAVRAYALAAFFETFRKFWERDRAFLLEFSCWCDGSHEEEEEEEYSFLRLHHRHMIVMARNGKDFYENFWKKFEINNQQQQGGRYKICRSWIQLKNTILCLSSRKASCNFFDWSNQPNLCHFYIFRSLSPDFKWRVPLKLASKEGMAETITILMREIPVTEFASKCSLGSRRMWRVKFGDAIEIIDGNNFLLWLSSYLPESMKNDWWYPPRKQQEILDHVVPLMKKIEWLNMGREKSMEGSEMMIEMKKQLKELKIGLNEIKRQSSSSTTTTEKDESDKK